MIAPVMHRGRRGKLVACNYCPARVEWAPGAVRCGMRRLHALGWRLRRNDTACPACVEAQSARDLAPELAASVAIARARNVAAEAVAEMACTTGGGEEAA